MVSTYTPNKYLEAPGLNDYINSWNTPVNSNFSRIDSSFGGVTAINLNGVSGTLDLNNSFPLPTSAPYSYIGPTINLSGTPSNNVIIRVPSGVGGTWNVIAGYGGSFTVTFSSLGGGTSVVLAQGWNNQVVSDGTNIRSMALSGRNVGTSANNLVALDASARLPAVDGSQLFNLPSGSITGSILMYAGVTEPSGWLFCDGRSLSQASYPALYSAIGTIYGSAGAGLFSLPDARGRVLAGRDNMGVMGTAGRLTSGGSGINGTVVGAAGGLEAVTLNINQIPPHTHNYVWWGGSGGGGKGDGGPNNSGTTSSAGGGQSHLNVQPALVVCAIIKT